MDGLAIFQGYHAQVSAQFGDVNPIAHTSVRLDLPAGWFAQGSLTPLALNVRAFAQNLFFKIASSVHCGDACF